MRKCENCWHRIVCDPERFASERCEYFAEITKGVPFKDKENLEKLNGIRSVLFMMFAYVHGKEYEADLHELLADVERVMEKVRSSMKRV